MLNATVCVVVIGVYVHRIHTHETSIFHVKNLKIVSFERKLQGLQLLFFSIFHESEYFREDTAK